MESGVGAETLRAWDATRRRLLGLSWGLVMISRRGRRRDLRLQCRSMNRDGRLSRAACGRYARGTAGGGAALRAGRLQGCATRPLRKGGKQMMGYEEKMERIELIDAVSDAGRLARGLD